MADSRELLFGDNIEWVNTQPLSKDDFANKIVVLDFFTSCCINCIQILPTLERLEKEFGNQILIIGVHSPKFEAEKRPERLLEFVTRYEISHPVVSDPDFTIWRHFGLRSWPTLVFISHDGQVLGQVSGEPDADQLAAEVNRLIHRGGGKGEKSEVLVSDSFKVCGPSKLRYPTCVRPLGSVENQYLIVNSGTHQVFVVDQLGSIIFKIGTGNRGDADGDLQTAEFAFPKSAFCLDLIVYVADTGNHKIRVIDLERGTVSTLFGNGIRGGPIRVGAHASGALASPWDVVVRNNSLIFSNAGSHQIGIIDVARNLLSDVIGSGGEDLKDGDFRRSLLAQPSGLTLNDAADVLYFVDSETSSVRRATMSAPNVVTTICGTGLFDFGNIDGPTRNSRFQHPKGISECSGKLAIADTFNNAIRLVDVSAKSVSSIQLSIKISNGLEPIQTFEPYALHFANSRTLLVADTNHHRILAVDPLTGLTRIFCE